MNLTLCESCRQEYPATSLDGGRCGACHEKRDLVIEREDAEDVVGEIENIADALARIVAGKADSYALNTLRGHIAGDGTLRLEFVQNWDLLLRHAQEKAP